MPTRRGPEPPCDPENDLSLAYEAPDLPEIKPPPGIPSQLDPAEKIRLFMSLFKGREDVYETLRKFLIRLFPLCDIFF